MSWAALTSRATAGLASNVCGSVLGLDMMALTWTYWPPTWLITSAYSFSAPTATILPDADPPSARAARARRDARGGDRRRDREQRDARQPRPPPSAAAPTEPLH